MALRDHYIIPSTPAEPTEAMLRAGEAAYAKAFEDSRGDAPYQVVVRAVITAALQAARGVALGEPPEPKGGA